MNIRLWPRALCRLGVHPLPDEVYVRPEGAGKVAIAICQKCGAQYRRTTDHEARTLLYQENPLLAAVFNETYDGIKELADRDVRIIEGDPPVLQIRI